LEKIQIKKMKEKDIQQASEILGKAFATQPSSLAIYKGISDPEQLSNMMSTVFEAMLGRLLGQKFVSKLDDEILGAMRIVKWPQCQMSPSERLRMLPTLIKSGGGLSAMKKGMEFRGTWSKSDPKKPHYHLDPLGVSPKSQGKGVGSQMMEYYCDIVDDLGIDAYHETDRPENVKFYQKFGFEVIKKEIILDFQNWYMWRSSNRKVQ